MSYNYDEQTGVQTITDGTDVIVSETVTAAKVSMLWWQERGLWYNLSRTKVPTRYMVQIKSDKTRRWRRLYSFADGNNPPVYVIVNKEMHFIYNDLQISELADKEH